MSLRIGQLAPEFDVVASNGQNVRLADYRGKKNVVLFFYPADFTLVCTREACGFRELYPELVSRDTEVIGISTDSNESHERFARENRIPFPLVADEDRALADAYDARSVLLSLFGRVRRLTYVISKHGEIAGIFEGELNASAHVDGVRAVVARLEPEAREAAHGADEAAVASAGAHPNG